MHDTRDGVIWRHLAIALRNSKLDRDTYGDDVAQLYLQRTPSKVRGLAFDAHTRGSDPYKVRAANRQRVIRMLDPDGPVRAPIELEEAAVLALPEPFRSACQRELAQRMGLLAAPLPAAQGAPTTIACGEFTREFGECLMALAATLGDGDLDPDDAAKSPAAIAALDALIAQATSLRAAHVANVEASAPAMPTARDARGLATVSVFPPREAGK